MTTLKSYLLITAFFSTCCCRSQFLSFNKSYGGPNDEYTSDMIRGSDGGFLMVGLTESYGPHAVLHYPNGYMVKTDENGAVQWNLAIGGTGYDYLSSVVATSDGGYMAVGVGNGNGDADMIILRVSSGGDVVWMKRFGTSTKSEWAAKIIALGGDQFVVMGSRFVYGGGADGNMLVMKFDGDGNIFWTSEFGSLHQDDPRDIALMDDGGFLITGIQFVIPHLKMVVVKLDDAGAFQWDHTYQVDGESSAVGMSLVRAPDGTFMVLGGAGGSHILTNLDNQGGVLWSKAYPTGFGSEKIIRTADDGFLITGTSYDTVAYIGTDHALLLDGEGSVLMHRAYASTLRSLQARTVVQNMDGSYTLAGSITSTDDGAVGDMHLIRCSADDMGLGSICFGLDDAFPVATTPVFTMAQTMTASPPPTMTVYDLPWAAYPGVNETTFCSNVGMQERPAVPSLTLYPNPAVGNVVIELPQGLAGQTLEICNATGQVVKNMEGTTGSTMVLNVTDWASGLYVCRVLLADGTLTQKVFEVR